MPAARVAAMMLVIFATFGSILFGCAGRLDLPFFWGYLAVVVGSMVGGALVSTRTPVAS